MTGINLLELHRLSLHIQGLPILKDLSLSLAAGEILGLVGASGSGKSLTALSVMRLLPAGSTLSGEVRLAGRSLSDMSAGEMQKIRGAQIGMVFQEPMTALNPLLRIGDQVAETVRLHRAVSTAEALREARGALEASGMSGADGMMRRYPYELSGGQRQRVAIAMAIVLRPALLIADEPTTALDVITQAQVLRLLADLARERHMGVILVSHDIAVIAQLADRVAVMQYGEIVDEGGSMGLLRHATHPYTRALLAAAVLERKVVNPSLTAGPVVLSVERLTREYARPRQSIFKAAPVFKAVDDVSLVLHAGETVGLVGESGSGKSTLLRAILALEIVQAGEVQILGENFSQARHADLRRLRRRIQVVFQDPYGSFDPRWTVAELIGEPFYLLDSPPTAAQREHKICEVLEQVGLDAVDASRRPHEFSGGQRQRIAIARALVTEPSVIAFDEAVSALDVLVRAQILQLLVQLSNRLGLAYLFVTHDLHVVHSIADRIYVMQRGKIVEEGETEALFKSPRHAYTQALIAATPTLSIGIR